MSLYKNILKLALQTCPLLNKMVKNISSLLAIVVTKRKYAVNKEELTRHIKEITGTMLGPIYILFFGIKMHQ